MTSETGRRFWKLYDRLPRHVREQAKEVFRRWRADPFDSSLEFKRLAGKSEIWSARVGLHYRVVGRRVGNHMVWDWIGPHGDYDTRIR